MARAICKSVFLGVVVLYIGAILFLLIGTFGWFGQPRDPLSGVFLMPLGLPWNLMHGDLAGLALPWVAVASPILNILILKLFCMRLSA